MKLKFIGIVVMMVVLSCRHEQPVREIDLSHCEEISITAQKKLGTHYCFKGASHSLVKMITISEIMINDDSSVVLVDNFFKSKSDLRHNRILKKEENRGVMHRHGLDTIVLQFDSKPDVTFVFNERYKITLIDHGKPPQTWERCR